MKKWFWLLLVLAPLFSIGQTPSVDFYPKSGMNPTGFMVVNKAGRAGVIIYLHGIGGRGCGSMDPWCLPALLPPDIHKALFGVDGGRNELPKELITAAVANDFAIAAPQTATSWTVADVNNVIDHLALSAYDKKKIYGIGFSLGGQGIATYILSSQVNAEKLAAVVIVAPIATTGNFGNIVNAKLPVLLAHSADDRNGGTPPSASGNFAAGINDLAPTIPADFILFNSGDHSGALSQIIVNGIPANPFTASAAWFNNPGCSIYQWFKQNTSDAPKRFARIGEGCDNTTPVPPVPVKTEESRFLWRGKVFIFYTDGSYEIK